MINLKKHMFRRTLTASGLCLGTLSLWVASVTSARSLTDLPVVDSAALGTQPTPPWSEPVQINDPFEGDFIGVFDRHLFFDRIFNTSVRVEVQSLWSPEEIRFLLTTRDRDCLSSSFQHRLSSSLDCSKFNNARNLISLFIRVNDDVFRIEGQNSTFPVSDELAQALRNAPEGNISIRLVAESGETIDSEIGEGTVEAWKPVYSAPLANLISE
ncbi:MAG: hypothetical protein ACFE0J_10940 [Elainellaceae cyanobacterium]